MSDIANPHDKFFSEVWDRKEIATDFLANYLPEKILKHLELDSLQLENRSYIDENLRDHYSDLLYSVNLAGGDTAFVYILLEHKRYADHDISVQLLRYMGAIWHQYLEDASSNSAGALPLIIPFVLYHGAERWQARTLSELVENVPNELRCYVPDFDVVFSDFDAVVSPEIRGKTHVDIFQAAMEYIFAVQGDVTFEEVRDAARNHISEGAEKEVVTVAEKFRKEGIEQGVREAIQEVLHESFGETPNDISRRLTHIHNIATLRRVHRSTLQAQSEDEVRRELEEIPNS